MEQVGVAVCEFAEELLIGRFQQLLERRQISSAVVVALTAGQTKQIPRFLGIQVFLQFLGLLYRMYIEGFKPQGRIFDLVNCWQNRKECSRM